MHSVGTWITAPNRQPFLRFLRFATITVLLLFLSCRVLLVFLGGTGGKDRQMLWKRSPSNRYTAVVVEAAGKGGATMSVDYVVRVQDNFDSTGRPSGREVWKAYGLAPLHLSWHTDDSLFVVVAKSELPTVALSAVQLKTGVLPFVGTEVRDMTPAEMRESRVWSHPARGQDDGPGFEDLP